MKKYRAVELYLIEVYPIEVYPIEVHHIGKGVLTMENETAHIFQIHRRKEPMGVIQIQRVAQLFKLLLCTDIRSGTVPLRGVPRRNLCIIADNI